MSARSSVPDANREVGPIRTCVGCRARERSTELLRVVAVDGALLPDPQRRLPGRGAWLHPESGCLDTAERRRAFGRALRSSDHLDITVVRGFLEAQGSVGSTVRSVTDDRSPSRLKQKAGRPKVITP